MGEEEKKDEGKKDEGKIILEARMHCESCRYKVYRSLIGYPGVEDINIDMEGQKVTLKAPKVDAKKLFETAKKKSKGKVTKLLHPDPSKEEKKKEDKKDEKKEEKKKPADVTVVLKVHMHCGACTKKVEKAAWKIGAVYNVKVDGELVTIKGKDLDPKKVCEVVMKKSGKHAEVVPPKKEEKKGEAKKDGEKKDGDKKDGEKKDGEKKDGEKKDGGDKKGGEKKDGDKKDDAKKEEKQPPKYIVEYVYAPQYFSDENPNACAIM
eukprot:c20567_g1_i1 orf=244-1035(-)